MNAKILTNEPQTDPLWMRALDRFGISTCIIVVLLWIGWRYVDNRIEQDALRSTADASLIEAQINTTKVVADAVKELTKSVEDRREFETHTEEVHAGQVEALAQINKALAEANETMACVPDIRREELQLLMQIRDKIAE